MSLHAGASVWTADRRRLRLGALLKSGGAGSIYPIVEWPDAVAKVYHDTADRAQYERKVAAMLDLSPQLPDLVDDGQRYVQIAWPQALLRDEGGHFVGFTMPAVDVRSTSELECILQERQAKAAGLPSGLGVKVTLAANLAAVIAELHRQGHHVLDLKPVNVRFYPKPLYMAMLDCDGFSIQGHGVRFAADQITPDYLAPEFQNQPIPEAIELQQDLFALAVVVFQLLNFGIHPFTGRPAGEHVPTDIPGRIARRCYAYGLRANADLLPSPVSGHLAMPADLRSLFDRGFDGAGAARPSATEWASTLKAYAQRSNQRLLACARDRQHQHFAGLPCAACARADLIASTARNAATVKSALPAAIRTPFTMGQWVTPRNPQGLGTPHLQPLLTASPVPLLPLGTAAHPYVVIRTNIPTRRRPWKDRILKTLLLIGMLALRLTPLWLHMLESNRDAKIAMETPFPHPPPRQAATAAMPMSATQDAMNNMVRSVARAALSGDPAAEARAMQQLQRYAKGQALVPPIDDYAKTGFEAGLSSLRNGDRAAACNAFVSAIAHSPEDGPAWYGLGAAAEFDDDAVGAWAIVEHLHPGFLNAAAHDNFWPPVLQSAGIDMPSLSNRQARAMQIADRLRGR